MAIHKIRFTLFLIVWCQLQSIAQPAESVRPIPTLPQEIKISYPKSNPLKNALQPVPESAIFKMEGYYLWDPSVIKVGDKYLIYHLGIPQWKTGFAFASSIEGPWTPVLHPVISTNNPALLIRPDGSAYAVGKFKPKVTRDGKWDANMQAFEAANYNGPYKLLQDTLNRLPGNFELEDPTIWWANRQYNVICTDWEAKVTGVQKSVICYTSKDGIHYELYSQIPVWSQTEPVPMQNGKSLNVKGIERPQVYVNDKGKLVALLASIYPAEGGPTYIIIRPVKNFVPKN